jgi:hypothetical protein
VGLAFSCLSLGLFFFSQVSGFGFARQSSIPPGQTLQAPCSSSTHYSNSSTFHKHLTLAEVCLGH